jgi:hypothetical protein
MYWRLSNMLFEATVVVLSTLGYSLISLLFDCIETTVVIWYILVGHEPKSASTHSQTSDLMGEYRRHTSILPLRDIYCTSP